MEALPPEWCAADAPAADCDTRHEGLTCELAIEVPPGHLLHGVPVRLAAHDLIYDDALFAHVAEPSRFTWVHLTWAGHEEATGFPTIDCDGTWQDFLAHVGAIDQALHQVARAEADGRRVPLGPSGTPSRPVVVRSSGTAHERA